MAIKEPQCEMCPKCRNFFALDNYHLHREDISPGQRECIPVEKLKKLGWKLSSSKIWSKS